MKVSRVIMYAYECVLCLCVHLIMYVYECVLCLCVHLIMYVGLYEWLSLYISVCTSALECMLLSVTFPEAYSP